MQGKMGKYDLSEHSFRRAIEIYGPTTQQAGRVWSNLGEMYLSQDREKDAAVALRSALTIRLRDPRDIGVAHTYTNLAELEARQGNLDASWRDAVRAFEIWNRAHQSDGEDTHIVELSRAIHNLGVLALDRGDTNSAVRYLRSALLLRPTDRSPEELMTTWVALADLAVTVRAPTDAGTFLDKAESIIESQHWQDRPAYVILCFKRSKVLELQRDSVGARTAQQRAMDNARKLYRGSPTRSLSEGEVAVLAELAQASTAQHDNATAISFARIVLQARVAETGPASLRTSSAWHNLAHAVGTAALDATGDAQTQGLEEALEMSRHAIDILRAKGVATVITACGDGGHDMGQDLGTVYLFHMILDYNVAQQRPERYSSLVQEAFEVGQLAQMSEGGPALRGLMRRLVNDQTVAESVRTLNNLVRDRCRADRSEVIASADQARLPLIDKNIDEALRKVGADPRLREFVTVEPVPLTKVVSLLKPDELLVTFHAGADRLLLQGVTLQDGSVRASAISQSTLLTAIRRLRASLTPASGSAGIASGFDVRASSTLYREILAPVVDPLTNRGIKINHLILVPDGTMEGLPFNALVTGWDSDETNPMDWKWLGDRFTLSVLPSVNALVNLPRSKLPGANEVRLVGFGDPASEGSLGLAPLPGAANEIRQAAAWFVNGPGDLHFGRAATKAAFLSQDFHKAQLLVVAAHSILPNELPGRLSEPAIVLAPDGDSDGFLTASAISALDLSSVNLVVLSACNTGVDDPGRNGVLSRLAQAFLSAGAASVLVSQWPVNDDATNKLMTGMLRRVADHADPVQALRDEMLQLRKQTNYNHPYYWAPFILVGLPAR